MEINRVDVDKFTTDGTPPIDGQVKIVNPEYQLNIQRLGRGNIHVRTVLLDVAHDTVFNGGKQGKVGSIYIPANTSASTATGTGKTKDPELVFEVLAVGEPSQFASFSDLKPGDLIIIEKHHIHSQTYMKGNVEVTYEGSEQTSNTRILIKDHVVEAVVNSYKRLKAS